MKVLHLPTSVGGNSWGLAQAEKQLGLNSDVLITANNWLNYPCDICLDWEQKSRMGMFLSGITSFLKYRREYDVFNFNFGSSLVHFLRHGIHLWDVPFYGKDKRLFFTYNGCDARQKDRTIERTAISPCHRDDCYGGQCNDGKLDLHRRKSIAKAALYADHMFALNPDLMHFLPADKSSFLPYTIPSWNTIDTAPFSIGKRIKIVHAPTNKGAKGSEHIIDALERLRTRYPTVDVQIIEGVPNEQALEMYHKADLVIDQILAGWYGGLAVEAMKMGKPVAAFIRKEDLCFIPRAMARDLDEAIININPSNIESVLEEYFQNPDLLLKKSQAALDFVHTWHDPLKVAATTKHFYET